MICLGPRTRRARPNLVIAWLRVKVPCVIAVLDRSSPRTQCARMHLHPRLVVFDLDGTLADSLGHTFIAMADAAEPVLGRRPSEADVAALLGAPDDGMIAQLVGAAHMPKLFDIYVDLFAKRPVSLYDDARALLIALRGAGIELAIWTGRGERTTNALVERLGLRPLLRMIVNGTEVVNGKPHPEGLQRILDATRIPASEAAMVGDSASDMRAANALGVAAIGAAWDSRARRTELEAAGAATICATIRDLHRLLVPRTEAPLAAPQATLQ